MTLVTNYTGTDNTWRIPVTGYYTFTVNTNTMKLIVARPVEVTGIDISPPSTDVIQGGHVDFTVDLTGQNTDLASAVTWTITPTHEAGTAFGTGENSNRLTVAATEAPQTLSVKAKIGTVESNTATVTVRDSSTYGSILIIKDAGAGLDIVGGKPATTPVIKKSGEPSSHIYTVDDPPTGHVYSWYVDDEIVTKGLSGNGSTVTLSAADYRPGYHTVRLVVKIGNVFWSMPAMLDFKVE
jgi:hypothetical protein